MQRLSPGTVIVGIFAVLFGLVGAYAVRQSLLPQQTEQAAPQAPPRTRVPVASGDLEPGRPITLGDVAIMQLSADQLKTASANWPSQYMINPDQIIGRTLKEPVPRGQPFGATDFYPEGMGPTVQDRLKPGFRAVTIPIASNSPGAGMAMPGAFVDVLFRARATEELDFPETTMTLLESVEVLAVGENIIPGKPVDVSRGFPENVTLAVSPEQAAALKVVESRGELMLTLRSADDLEQVGDIEPQTLESLLGVVVEPTPPAITTVIYRGNSQQMNSFSSASPGAGRVTARPVPRTGQSTSPQESDTVDDEVLPIQGDDPEAGAEAVETQTNAVEVDGRIVAPAKDSAPVASTRSAHSTSSQGGFDHDGKADKATSTPVAQRQPAAPRRQVRAQWSMMNSNYVAPPKRQLASAELRGSQASSSNVVRRPGVLVTPLLRPARPAAAPASPTAQPQTPKDKTPANTSQPTSPTSVPGRASTTLFRGSFSERRVYQGRELVSVAKDAPNEEANPVPAALAEVVRGGENGRKNASN